MEYLKKRGLAISKHMDKSIEYFMLREVSQKRQLPYVITYMWDLKHTTKEQTRNTIINTEKKTWPLLVGRGLGDTQNR